MISMARLTFVLPVPVTPFNHTVATDIINTPMVTVRITGIASLIKPPSRPYKARKTSGNRFITKQSDAVNAKLRRAIFFIKKIT